MNGAGITDLMSQIVAASTEASASAAEITLPGTPASVSVARRLVQDALPGCPRADDLMLAVSELATNCIAHTASGQGGTFTVRVHAALGWARVEVTDDGLAAGPPSRRNGWRLPIVAGVTDRSGAIVRRDGRRTAWAEVTWLP